MNCEKVREQIPELLAGRLDQAARESVVEHLESCAACRSESGLMSVHRMVSLRSKRLPPMAAKLPAYLTKVGIPVFQWVDGMRSSPPQWK